MLLRERMKEYEFSNSERIVVDFILEKENDIKELSTKEIANATFTSPSILIRIAKKLGYNGWLDLKEDYLKEVDYLHSHFQNIDPNVPFSNADTIIDISNKITALHTEAANDTLSLIQHDTLQKAVQIMRKSQCIKVFGVANILFLAEQFKYNMRHIGKKCIIEKEQDESYFEAGLSNEKDCAILISYSGETLTILKIAKILQDHHVPMIAITSIGENSLSKYANVTLHISTRERSYSKIAGFSSLESISLILDILYSCIFSLNYTANFNTKLSLSKSIETGRVITNAIIEDIKED